MEKLEIKILNKPDGSSSSGFQVMINPAKISYTRSVNYNNNRQSSGSSAGNTPKWGSYQPEQLSFELYFDGTGVISDDSTSVAKRLEDLEKTIYRFKGDKHRPNWLLISWNQLKFRGQIKSFKTDYLMFEPNGNPLRAKVALVFMECVDQKVREQMANKQSPDMTHIKTIREGDRLPLLCQDTYGDYGYYIQVAEKNNIINFRKLIIGEEISLPPLSK